MDRWSSYGSLFGGLLLVSTSAPFFVAAEMDAYTVSFARMALAGGLLLLAWMARNPPWAGRSTLLVWKSVSKELPLICLGSFIFVLHLLLWMKAFDYTSFSSVVLLLVAQPALAAVVGRYFGEKVQPAMWWSLGIAGIALAMVATGDLALGPKAWLGDAMCLLAALCTTLFIPATRRARATLPMPLFLGLVFSIGAIMLLPLIAWMGVPWRGYAWESWGWLLAIVLIPTIGGHGLTNLAARRVSLFRLNIVILLQPLIALGMGASLFGASASTLQLAGGALLLLAVGVGLWGTRDPPFVPA